MILIVIQMEFEYNNILQNFTTNKNINLTHKKIKIYSFFLVSEIVSSFVSQAVFKVFLVLHYDGVSFIFPSSYLLQVDLLKFYVFSELELGIRVCFCFLLKYSPPFGNNVVVSVLGCRFNFFYRFRVHGKVLCKDFTNL